MSMWPPIKGSNNRFRTILVVVIPEWHGGHGNMSKNTTGFIHCHGLVVTDAVVATQARCPHDRFNCISVYLNKPTIGLTDS